jgi:hypothetical protein
VVVEVHPLKLLDAGRVVFQMSQSLQWWTMSRIHCRHIHLMHIIKCS